MDWIKKISSEKALVILVSLAVVGMAFIYLGKEPTDEPKSEKIQAALTDNSGPTTKIGILEKELESKLQTNILMMEGVGKVKVSVNFLTGLRSEYVRNNNITKRTNKESDKTGGTRETTEVTENNQVVMPNGTSQPVIAMEDRPEIGGVLIIAEGAKDPAVREGIHTAVQTLLNIESAKITVVPMGGV